MDWSFYKGKEKFTYFDSQGNQKIVWAWNHVRTLANGLRKKNEVVKTEPLHGNPSPYDPHLFPNGRWQLLEVIPHNDNTYLNPYFIKTDAYQMVQVWSLDSQGNYLEPTQELQVDGNYGIHFSSSDTTLGCIRIAKLEDLEDIVKVILESKENIYINIYD